MVVAAVSVLPAALGATAAAATALKLAAISGVAGVAAYGVGAHTAKFERASLTEGAAEYKRLWESGKAKAKCAEGRVEITVDRQIKSEAPRTMVIEKLPSGMHRMTVSSVQMKPKTDGTFEPSFPYRNEFTEQQYPEALSLLKPMLNCKSESDARALAGNFAAKPSTHRDRHDRLPNGPARTQP